MKKLSTILLVAVSLVSCDPPHFITLNNKTNTEAKVKLMFKDDAQDTIFIEREYASDSDSVVVLIKAKHSEVIHFGIGTWSDSSVSELADALQSLEIETGDIKTVYKTEKSIETFLKENRNGFINGWQKEIEIDIE